MRTLWICLLLAAVAAASEPAYDTSYEYDWDAADDYAGDIIETEDHNQDSSNINDNKSLEQDKDEQEPNEDENSLEKSNEDYAEVMFEDAGDIQMGLEEKTDVEKSADSVSEEKNENSKEETENKDDVQADDIAKLLSEKVADDYLNSDEIEELYKSNENEDDANDFESDNVEEDPVQADIIKETKQILEKTNSDFEEASSEEEPDQDDQDDDDDTNQEVVEDTNNSNQVNENVEVDEDTLDKVYKDLNEDLQKLEETFKKLSSDDNEPREENADDSFLLSKLLAHNELDYVNGNLSDENGDNKSDNVSDEDQNDDNSEDSVDTSLDADLDVDNENHNENNNDEENDDEFSNDDDSIDDVAVDPASDEQTNNDADIFSEDNMKKPAEKAAEETSSAAINIAPIHSQSDEQVKTSQVEFEILEDADNKNNDTLQEVEKINMEDITPELYNQIMEQFKLAHGDDLDPRNNEFDRNVAPIHISLSLDEATTVTSPNYPLPYPTNNVVDWSFTGDGMGIELNVTDFFVNGVLGDYVLFVPGGLDTSRTDGLVFSFRLDAPRRYRFFDVDTMFVRFVSHPGMAFTRGFSFSAKMILPRRELDEDLPEPEELAPVPNAEQTFTLLIGGVTLPEFRSNKEQFREIVADMATMYMNAFEINPGRNATLDVTQITRTAVCNVQWPGYEHCSKVTIGVPLMYDDADENQEGRLTEEDLRAMWYLYSDVDPFASRLRRLGMSEFTVPDSATMTVWVVAGVGVVVTMAMIGFALWRYSCFENYSRMPAYSDQESVYSEKAGLDLYPTPHQTLPPLYAENDYKWDDAKYDDSTRVDLGGFANKSYARDMYDFESDEDVVVVRDRKSDFASEKYDV